MPPAEIVPEKKITARKVVFASFGVDLLDLILNISVAFISGSVVMLTEVLESIADLTASGFLIIGLKRSTRREDATHPFGYGREIYFWTLLSALIMFGITSSLSFYFGFQRFMNPKEINDVWLVLLVLAITSVTNFYAFGLSFRRLLRKRKAKHIVQIFYRSSLAETKNTFVLDLMGALSSVFGGVAIILYVITGDYRFDGLGAMLMGSALAVCSIFLITGIRDLLIGRSASHETENKIKEAALKTPEVKQILELKTLHVGAEKLLVNLEVHMESRLSTREIEKLMDEIKDNIAHEVPSVKYIQVELETPNR